MRWLGVDTPWEAFAAVRAPIYARILEDPEASRKGQWIMDDPEALPSAVRRMTGERKEGAQGPTGEKRRE